MEEEIDKDFLCLDCNKDTLRISEYYMVHDKLWLKASPNDFGMLCIKCLEKRLNRKLSKKDFTDCPVNQGIFGLSPDLANRLGVKPIKIQFKK